MRVIVGMPTFGAPTDLLLRAVKSVFAQTHDDLTLVVVNDGGEELKGLPDSDRLLVYRPPRNEGQYFAASVVSESLAEHPDVFWTEHDHDDCSDPAAIESRIPFMQDGAVVSPFWMHEEGKPLRVVNPSATALSRVRSDLEYPMWHRAALVAKRLGAPLPDLRHSPGE